jgi:acetyl esterase/lipase
MKIPPQSFQFAERPNGPLSLDLYHPDDAARPLVIYAYGGGFAKGRRGDLIDDPLIQHLCAKGFAVAVPDYRLKTSDADLPEQTAAQVRQIATRVQRNGLKLARSLYGPRLFTACEDVSDAIKYCRTNATKMNLLDGKVGMIGVSAGGITGNALCYPPGGQWAQLERPDIMVSLAAPIVHPWRLGAGGPPLWVIHGQHDRILPIADSVLAQKMATEAGANVIVDMPKEAPHIQIVRYVMQTQHQNGKTWAENITKFLSR